MSRLGAALAVLLLAAPLAALLPPSAAQAPTPGMVIPTQKDAAVGPVNVTVWLLRDTRTLTASPELRLDPFGFLFGTNFTAGSTGFLNVRAKNLDNGSYVLSLALSSPGQLVQLVQPLATDAAQAAAQNGGCVQAGLLARCPVDANRTDMNAVFSFYTPLGATLGPLRLDIEAAVQRNATPPEELGRHTFGYDLRILDPFPTHAVKTEAADTTLGAWTSGGPYGATPGGCLAGSAGSTETTVGIGAPGVICLVAVTRSTGPLRLTANLSGPAFLTATEEGWRSEAFNRSSGGLLAPIHGFPFLTTGASPLGGATARVHYVLERQNGAAWEPAGEGDIEVPFTVTSQTLVTRGTPGLNWLAHGPLLIASVAGLGYLAYTNRQPKFEARSQSLRDQQLRRKTKDDDAATAAIVQQQREEVQEQSFEKKRVILDAKRDDILKSITIAEERHQRGEITEHVLKGIRERKERQLEQVQKEIEELGQ